MNKRLTMWLTLLLLTAAGMKATATEWTDVTGQFIQNPTFDSDDGSWTWTTSTGTAGIASGNARFYGGTFDFHQTLSSLPKGHYRLSVQSFYRDGGNAEAWSARQNGTESIDAYLYAGTAGQQLASIFSEWLDYNAAGRSWSPDNTRWYPDGRDAAGIAIDAGHYWNTLEFDVPAKGSVTVGIRCNVSKGSNYCVIDNFKLEYDGDPDAVVTDGWADVTAYLISSPAFDDNSADGWQWENNGSCNIRVESMEFWQSRFHLWQDLTGLPDGHYRLSVQSFYRQGNNTNSYNAYKNGTENMTAYMYAGNRQQTLVSPYSYELPSYTSGCWGPNVSDWWPQPPYFPNTMETAAVAFADDAYWNTLEFDAGGSVTIGLRNDNWASDNWTIFDNFRLEYQVATKATSVSVSLPTAELMAGESVKATAAILPANTLRWVKWTSSDETVATVGEDGTVTGVNPGTVTITAKTIDGSGLSSSATLRVAVNAPTAGSLVINEIMASNVDEFISPAFNFDGWVELYNPSSRSVTLAGCYVSTDMQNLKAWRLPNGIGALPAGGYAVLWFDSNDIAPQNAPFKLDVDGGAVYISDQNGNLVAQQTYPASTERVSYARTTDGGSVWGLAVKATPGSTNAATDYAAQQLEAPVVDQPSQLFSGSLTVSVDIPDGCTLRYTTDGKLPTEDYGETSTDGRFDIGWTTSLRLRLFRDGWLPSRVTSRSYIYRDRDYTLPVVSVVTDPDFIYSSEIGVFATGPNGRPGNGRDDKCNWNMNWERPVNFSYLGSEGLQVLNQDANLEMCGGWSRAWTPHSFKLKGNKELGGTKYLPYQFFGQKPYIRNRTLQIRNGGNDAQNPGGRFIDPAIQYMVETSGFNIDCQSYQPVHEFINGQYMGLLNVREPNNKHFVDANYGWDDDEIDQFEMSPDSGYVQKCGTPDAFNHLVDDLSPNAADAATYAEIGKLLDIDAYANYMATEFYLGGTDWPQNNVKGFRYRQDGRFRFVLFDIDFAFNTNDPFNVFMNKETYTFDQLRPASLGRITAQIRFVTLFKNLLKNAGFRKQFIDAYCLVGGSVLEASRAGEIVDQLQEAVSGPMDLENIGWRLNNSANKVRSGLANRLPTAINYLKSYSPMQLSGVKQITASFSANIDGAKIQLNGHDVPTASFNGTLFAPAVLKASAPEGYTFKGWKSGSTVVSQNEEYDISGQSSVTLTAIYEKLTDDNALREAIAMPVKVNEVSAANTVYVSDTWKRADWFELYNTTDTELDVRGLYLSDDIDQPLKFQIQQSAKIPVRGHLVVWADGLGTGALGGQASQIHTSFKLSNTPGQQVFVVSSAEFVENNAKFFNKHPELKTFIDGLTYTAHTGQQTVGRYPDGGRNFYLMERPTIERTNTLTTTDRLTGTDQNLMSLLSDAFTLQLAKGWNWTSHCLASPVRAADLSARAARIVGQQQECMRTTQGMTGTLTALDAGRLYKVLMDEADTYTAADIFCQPDMPITLLPGWNWVGYPVSGTQTLAEALADFSAEEGDQIVGQDGFAVYTASGWKGTLTSLATGHGYMLNTRQAKTLTYTAPAQSLNLSRAALRGKTAIDYGIDKHAYPNVMGIIGTLERQGRPVEPGRFTLLAYNGGECRGAAAWVDDLVFMTAYGEGGEPLQFYAKDLEDGTVYHVNTDDSTADYLFAAGVFGTLPSPHRFSIGDAEAVGIDGATAAGTGLVEGYYNLGGMRVGNHSASLPKGIYIVKMNNGSHRKIYIK